MATKKKRSRRRPTAAARAGMAIARLEKRLPERLGDYVKQLREGLATLEKQVADAQANTRRQAASVLREATHQLGQLEERGEAAWRRLTGQYRKDAEQVLERVERAILAGTGTPRGASKKSKRTKASKKTKTSKKVRARKRTSKRTAKKKSSSRSAARSAATKSSKKATKKKASKKKAPSRRKKR
jgi:hypothetical protein